MESTTATSSYSGPYHYPTDEGNTLGRAPTRFPDPLPPVSLSPVDPAPYVPSCFPSIDTDRPRDREQSNPSFTHLTGSALPDLDGDEPDNSDDCCLCWLAKKVWNAVVVIFSALFCCSCCYDNKPEEAIYARLDEALIPLNNPLYVFSDNTRFALANTLKEIAKELVSLDLTTLSQDLDRRSCYENKIRMLLNAYKALFGSLVDTSQVIDASKALLPPLEDPIGKATQLLQSTEKPDNVYIFDDKRNATVHPYFLQLETLFTALESMQFDRSMEETTSGEEFKNAWSQIEEILQCNGYRMKSYDFLIDPIGYVEFDLPFPLDTLPNEG
ncbi:MAG: hypothetical protein HY860_06360 [Chlamydiales bacterium]|nr:hypothetical protein [Chlamydiales bacterium]